MLFPLVSNICIGRQKHVGYSDSMIEVALIESSRCLLVISQTTALLIFLAPSESVLEWVFSLMLNLVAVQNTVSFVGPK